VGGVLLKGDFYLSGGTWKRDCKKDKGHQHGSDRSRRSGKGGEKGALFVSAMRLLCNTLRTEGEVALETSEKSVTNGGS